LCYATRCGAVLRCMVRCCAALNFTAPHRAAQCGAAKCSAVRCGVMWCGAAQCGAVHCCYVLHSAVPCSTVLRSAVLHRGAVRRMQCCATRCGALLHFTPPRRTVPAVRYGAARCRPVACSAALYCLAVCVVPCKQLCVQVLRAVSVLLHGVAVVQSCAVLQGALPCCAVLHGAVPRRTSLHRAVPCCTRC
jgi:hypothetical protein